MTHTPDFQAPGQPPVPPPWTGSGAEQVRPVEAAGSSAPVPDAPVKAKRNWLTAKPTIGVAALIVGLAIGAGGSAGRTGGAAPLAGAGVTATATVTATETATYEASPEPSEAETAEPADAATSPAEPADTSYKYGQKVGFTYEDVEITVQVDAPKASTNTFDRDNLEAKVTVCNKGSDTIDELSAEGIGLYAEDKAGGRYELYGPYRAPEFPVYGWDSSSLKAGKCRTGWVSFEDGRKAVRIATDVSDTTYTWSASGK